MDAVLVAASDTWWSQDILYEYPLLNNVENCQLFVDTKLAKLLKLASSDEYCNLAVEFNHTTYLNVHMVDLVSIPVELLFVVPVHEVPNEIVVYVPFTAIATCFGFTYRVWSVPVATSASVAISTSHLFDDVAMSQAMTIISVPLYTQWSIAPLRIDHVTSVFPSTSLRVFAPRAFTFTVQDAVFEKLVLNTNLSHAVYAVYWASIVSTYAFALPVEVTYSHAMRMTSFRTLLYWVARACCHADTVDDCIF